jgi:hypothetical protein
MLHHQRIGLAHKVGLDAGGQFDGSDQRSGGRGNPLFNRIGISIKNIKIKYRCQSETV